MLNLILIMTYVIGISSGISELEKVEAIQFCVNKPVNEEGDNYANQEIFNWVFYGIYCCYVD